MERLIHYKLDIKACILTILAVCCGIILIGLQCQVPNKSNRYTGVLGTGKIRSSSNFDIYDCMLIINVITKNYLD